MDLRELRAESDSIRSNIGELIQKAGELTDSEVGDLEAAETRLLEVNKQVQKAELIERATKAIDTPTFTRRGVGADDNNLPDSRTRYEGTADRFNRSLYEETAQRLASAARGETRAYNTSDDSALMPIDLQDQMVKRLPKLSAVRQAATVQTFTSNARIPAMASRVATAVLTSEAAAAQELEGTYTDIDIDAFSIRAKSEVTFEALQDARGGLVANILEQHVESHAEGWDALYLATQDPGTRTAPMGLCATGAHIAAACNSSVNDVDAPSGVDTAAELDINDLISTINGLPGRYRTGSKSWIMSPTVHAQIVSSTDPNSRLVFLPQATGTVQENPLSVGTILGFPVYLSDAMPSAADDAVACILLDRRSYMIADRRSFETRLDDSSAADNGKFVYRSFTRSDGVWMLPEASARLLYTT